MLDLFDQGRHRKHSNCRGLFDERIVDLCSLHQCLDGPKLPGCATFFFFRSLFKLVFLSYYKLEILHHELSLKHKSYGGVLR